MKNSILIGFAILAPLLLCAQDNLPTKNKSKSTLTVVDKAEIQKSQPDPKPSATLKSYSRKLEVSHSENNPPRRRIVNNNNHENANNRVLKVETTKPHPNLKSSTSLKSCPEKSNIKQVHYPAIPGYTTTGNSEIDAQNYAKAKLNLYKNHPDVYKKLLLEYSENENQIQEIPYEKYMKLPLIRQQHIDNHPDKYRVVKE